MNVLYECERPHCLSTVWERGCGFIWMRGETLFFENPRNRFMRFRRAFELSFEPVAAELRILTDTYYRLWLNGEGVARGPSRSDFTYTYYDCHEASSWLRKGSNTIAVLALFQGFGTGRGNSIMQGMLFQLIVHGAGGERHVIISDRDWRASPADEFVRPTPRLHGPLGCIEVQDMRLQQEGWTLPLFDDSDWALSDYIKADLRVTPWYYFVQSPVPPRREGCADQLASVRHGVAECRLPQVEELGAPRVFPSGLTTVPTAESGVFPLRLDALRGSAAAHVVTLDFGRIENGLLRLEVEAPEGAVVDALFSDSLAQGDVIPKPEQARILTSRWILKGGRQRLSVAFNWLAFRYVQLWIWAEQPLTIHRAWIKTLYYPLPESVASFRCNDPFLNWLDDVCTHTVRLCYQDAIVDSPSREQQQWIGDARKTAIYNHCRWGDAVLHRNLIEQIGQGMDWMGTMWPRYPSGNRNVTPIPSYCLDWVMAFEEYFLYTGDDSLITAWWPNILLAIRWFSAFERAADGLLADVPHWLYIDLGKDAHGRPMGNGEILTSLNLQYLAALRTVAGYARRLGQGDSRRWFEAKAERLARAIRTQLWHEQEHCYADACSGTVLTNGASEVTTALALLHLEEPGSKRAAAMIERVFIAPDTSVVRCSPFSVHLVLEAFTRYGLEVLGLAFIRERYEPLQKAGATATWEHWRLFSSGSDGNDYPHCASSCHAWGAAPMAFFTYAVLGISPLEPGWQSVRIKPVGSALEYAKGECLTPRGLIAVEWKVSDGVFTLSIRAPEGMEGQIILPDDRVLPLLSGTYCCPAMAEAVATASQQPVSRSC